jgi:hypothetical protein
MILFSERTFVGPENGKRMKRSRVQVFKLGHVVEPRQEALSFVSRREFHRVVLDF